MGDTPEGRVKKNIKKWMKKVFPKAFCFMPRQSGYGQNGIPDHIYCVPVTITEGMVGEKVGLFVGIEAKTAIREQTSLQAMAEQDILDAYGEYKLVRGSDDIEPTLGSLRIYEDNS